METIKVVWDWVVANYMNVIYFIAALVTAAEIFTRFTKTDKDDGFVERIGSIIKKVMDWLKIPNRVK